MMLETHMKFYVTAGFPGKMFFAPKFWKMKQK